MKVWVLAQVKNADATHWELGGIFTTEDKAVAACADEWDGVWPVELDELTPRDETVEVGYYPLEKADDE